MITVLVVEDDAVANQAHQLYVGRMPGFEVAGTAKTGQEALRILDRCPVDLVLLDLRLPDMDGLRLARSLRHSGRATDVIAVTSARDLREVRASVASGVMQYLLKPFTFAAMRDKLEQYARFRNSLDADREVNGQGEIDQVFATLRGVARTRMPKGMSEETLAAVITVLRTATEQGATAGAVGTEVGMSRVTARRYLEHLVDSGQALRRPQYGGVGRPEMAYCWISSF